MASVDPRLQRIPKDLLKDRDIRNYFEELERFLHDLWVRTGGGNDIVEDNQSLSFNAIQSDLSNVKIELDNIKRTSNAQVVASLSLRIEQIESSMRQNNIGYLMQKIDELEAQLHSRESTGQLIKRIDDLESQQ